MNIHPTPLGREQVSKKELINLCAVDSNLYNHTFFPKTVRQKSPPFHQEIWSLLEGPGRYVNVHVFRDGAKTTTLRLFSSKRIAYGLAHTVLWIGKSEGHAARSIRWLRRQVEYNKFWSQTFNLRPGDKWQDTEAEIWHGTDEYPIWIIAMGITGSVRGINIDDFRPDLIVIDDVIDEENSATEEQRDKIENLILGALKGSLAPASEMPDAKLVMLQTPLNKEDASCKALADPEWKSAVYGCWTEATADLPLNQQESSWPERYSSKMRREEKEAAIQRNKLSIFLREKECILVSQETTTFREHWLQFYDIIPPNMRKIMVIDPVPPPTTQQIAKGMRGKDYEAFAVVGRHAGNFYLLDYSLNRGHEPDWTIAEFFRLAYLWKPMRVVVETIAYQKTLEWLLKKAMQHQKRYYVIKCYRDKRAKYDRISDGLSGPASQGHLFVRREHVEFISQFRTYPTVSHDDLIESVAIGVAELSGIEFEADDEESARDILIEESHIPALQYGGGAP